MEKRFDVVIVGARVGGASLAIRLGEIGKKVLLLDKASFPSDTLSTHHMSHVEYLKKLGVLEEVETSGLRKINRMRTYIGSSFVEGPRASYTIIPKRDHLDHILLKRTKDFPSVTLKENHAVRELIWEGDKVVGVIAEDSIGYRHSIYCDLVVGADGKHSNIAHWVQAEEYKRQDPLRPVLYGYYEGVKPLQEPTTEIFLNDGRIGFLFPMEEGRDCLGLEIHPDEFKAMMKSPKESFEQLYASLYGMEGRLQKAKLQGRIIGTSGMPNFFRKAYGKGWALIGDAGHSKDPSTGLGINDAFMQSFLLAETLQLVDQGESPSQALEAFQEERDRRLMPGFHLTLNYVQSLRKWTKNEQALFQAMASNPMVWNKLVPNLSEQLKREAADIPLLHESVKLEAESFGYIPDY
ncbi:NAD(P)/FAD-dependent oxidoreductase [Halobacillus sp. BBL2006]|uniref:NAD(P)/FAD-dependent oxidoreductase n=1 Tax=Halobacillus sp. BBL2006 TaxID=1543706 RepID=UPI000542C240|nr:NAD(P)/FAD-dependent oxidoreductase [Halobacillus sp. BBL2006]KHE67657.1 FAD-dependent oxidoreductase [Halobacillus sp. BBL2006]